ncbi:MAG: PIN domain-containing protein [Gaiellaceae bacterium MAG52_C11]|nr:PIN domain-containing protein [Candidatus Gaiellasilicea maunaloa]
MALIVLDASVLIAHFDQSDALHEAATKTLAAHEADDLRLPASAYAETLVGAAARGEQSLMTTAILELGVTIEPITATAAERSAAFRARDRSLRTPDALVLGCAEALDAATVLTGDRRWARFPRVRILSAW